MTDQPQQPATSPELPPTTPYDDFGGEAFFERLVAAFYARVKTDPILKPMYPDEDMAGAQWRLQHFLMQYWGGPQTYSEERGHPRLRARHMDFRIDAAARDRWLSLMHDAMVEQDLSEEHESQLWMYLIQAAFAMQNVEDDPFGQATASSPAPDTTLPVSSRNASQETPNPARTWWRDAVVYQVYPRSFADSDGDGMGDIPGLISRLPYLHDLGVDAIWISPFYTSPLHDGGYDVADYRSIDPRLGTMRDVDRLIAEAHARDIRVIMDIVPNHSSSEHPWFQEALASEPGSAAWDRYIVREGKGEDRETPPNNWRSVFHGRGWSHVRDADGNPTGYWYLHLFDTTQPDLNWENPEVRAEFRDILRFWFDRGIDGFRIDVAHGLVKEDGLPDYAYPSEDEQMQPEMFDFDDVAHAPFWDQDGVHEIYREWRAVADAYDPPRIFCGETWVPNPERLARYQRPDELHTSFNFAYLEAGWDADRMRRSIDDTIANHAKVGAPPTWVLSNHDVVRHRTRMAPGFENDRRLTCEVDEERGLRRARAATLFTMALPGSMYLYQGEELGLPEVRDLAPEDRQDPAWHRSGGTDGMRDGCRVPLPWSGAEPSFGFGPGSQSWLPQPTTWADLSVATQEGVAGSTLEMYRAALGLRRAEDALGEGPLEWLVATDDLLAFRRPAEDGPGVVCVLNLATTSATLPPAWGTDVLLASSDDVAVLSVDEDSEALAVGSETALWLRNA